VFIRGSATLVTLAWLRPRLARGGYLPQRTGTTSRAETNPKFSGRVAGMARHGMDRGWVLLGFWRFVIGE